MRGHLAYRRQSCIVVIAGLSDPRGSPPASTPRWPSHGAFAMPQEETPQALAGASGSWPNLRERFDMDNVTPFDSPDGLWRMGTWEDTAVRIGPKRNRAELVEQVNAIRALVGDAPSVIYAMRMHYGVIKIGCTTNLVRRRYSYQDAEILAFRPGDFAEEKAIHKSLTRHLVYGREWYKPVPAVLDVVNEMRDHFHLEPLPYVDAA